MTEKKLLVRLNGVPIDWKLVRTTPEQVLKATGQLWRIPVNPVDIAYRYGVKVFLCDIDNAPNVHGFLRLEENRNVAIYIDNECPAERRSWTIAHELGHFFFGHLEMMLDGSAVKSVEIDGKHWKERCYGAEEMCREADLFASRLMMPAELVKTAIVGVGVTSLDKLAMAFCVPEIIMYGRLIDMGIVKDVVIPEMHR